MFTGRRGVVIREREGNYEKSIGRTYYYNIHISSKLHKITSIISMCKESYYIFHPLKTCSSSDNTQINNDTSLRRKKSFWDEWPILRAIECEVFKYLFKPSPDCLHRIGNSLKATGLFFISFLNLLNVRFTKTHVKATFWSNPRVWLLMVRLHGAIFSCASNAICCIACAWNACSLSF